MEKFISYSMEKPSENASSASNLCVCVCVCLLSLSPAFLNKKRKKNRISKETKLKLVSLINEKIKSRKEEELILLRILSLLKILEKFKTEKYRYVSLSFSF